MNTKPLVLDQEINQKLLSAYEYFATLQNELGKSGQIGWLNVPNEHLLSLAFASKLSEHKEYQPKFKSPDLLYYKEVALQKLEAGRLNFPLDSFASHCLQSFLSLFIEFPPPEKISSPVS